MAIWIIRESLYVLLLSLVFSLGYATHATKNQGLKKAKAGCMHIVSINVPSDDPAQSNYNYAFKADGKQAFLSKNPGLFRLKQGGFLGIKETVSIESAQNPGHFLRHKNYRFHLQKPKNNSVFARDATFYLLKVQKDPPLFAFELYDHPSWFIMHDNKDHRLKLGHVTGSESQVIDSTFSFKKANCLHKHRQGRVQKKTVVVGHGSLMEDQSDDNPTDSDLTEEYDDNDNAKIAAFQSIVKDNSQNEVKGSEGKLIDKSVVGKDDQKDDDQNTASVTRAPTKTEPGNVDDKEQDIINEVEQAFKSSTTNKNGHSLDVMEKDIESKVNDLASSLYEENSRKTSGGERRTFDVEIQDNDLLGTDTPERQPQDEDIIIKTEDSAAKTRALRIPAVKPAFHGTHLHDTSKHTLFSDKGLKSVNTFAFAKNNKGSLRVVKGSPKLVNEHYDIIARASLAIPEGIKRKQQMWKSNGVVAATKHNQIINSQDKNKYFQTKKENTTRLFGSLSGSVHVSNQRSSLWDRSAVGDQRDVSYTGGTNDEGTKIKQNATKLFFRYTPGKKLNGRPVVYFSEKCQNVLPNVCEIWAQKRYCLTFNELMKRYCRKSCGLCDQIVTTGFSPCDKSCGGGIRLRMIKVNNRQVLQRRACNTHFCPIDGGYTPFSNLSECSATCGKGLRYKHRTCTEPPPQFGGKDCTRLGSPVQTVECHVAKCNGEGNKENKLRKEKKVSKKPHSLKQTKEDYDNMPEYHVEKLNNGYTVKTDTLTKLSSRVLKHVHGNLYEYVDGHGNKKHVRLGGRHSKSLHDHHVYHQGNQVAKLKCGISKFLKYHRVEPNLSLTSRSNLESQDDNLYKMYEGGKITYDKYGMPSGTTDEVVKSSTSPYKIILHKNKNHQLVVSEECLETDSSVDPDEDDDENKDFSRPATQGFYGYDLEDPTHSFETSSLLAQNTLGNEVSQAMGSIGRAMDYDTNALASSTLMQKEVPKLSLSEELADENEEALKERQYEEKLAEKSGNYVFS